MKHCININKDKNTWSGVCCNNCEKQIDRLYNLLTQEQQDVWHAFYENNFIDFNFAQLRQINFLNELSIKNIKLKCVSDNEYQIKNILK